MLTNVGFWLYQHSFGVAALGLPAMALCVLGLSRNRDHRLDPTFPKNGKESAAKTFAQLLASHGFDPGIALATFCYLDESTGGRLPIQPENGLEKDLGFAPEEIEHTFLALSALLGRKPALHLQRQPITTVEDLIGVLQAAKPESKQDARAAA